MASVMPDLQLTSQPSSIATATSPVLISHPAEVGGWVGLGGYLHTKIVYPWSPIWVLNGLNVV